MYLDVKKTGSTVGKYQYQRQQQRTSVRSLMTDMQSYQCLACDENMFSFEAIKNDTALTDNEAKNMLEYVLRELELDRMKD